MQKAYSRISNGYAVNVDSNHNKFLLWMMGRYGRFFAGLVVATGVSPDEIALDSDVNNYRRVTVRD